MLNVCVALRKESVDRNVDPDSDSLTDDVALRKESVDRNRQFLSQSFLPDLVALRKESVDRNNAVQVVIIIMYASLSARRAWIEIRPMQGRRFAPSSRSPQGERG